MAPFCSCPASLVSRKFFAVGPGCAKCFFFCCAPLGAATFRRGQSKKKKHHPGCFFFAPAPGEGRGRRSPVGRGFSFPCLSPGPEQKKKTPLGVFFFAAAPRGRSPLTAGLGGDASPVAGVVFFFFAAAPEPDRGGVFFFCCGPARTLTHSLWAGAISARPGWCFFFLLRPRRVFLDNNKKCLGYYIGSKKTRRGHSKKKKHHFQGVFFCSGPVPAPNGASPSPAVPGAGAKKKTPWVVFFFFALAPCRLPTGLLLPLPFAGAAAKKNTPWVVNSLGGVFFLLWPRAGAQRGFSFPCLSPGPEQKKKNTLGGVFFFAAAPRGRSLTHCGPGWRCLPLAGVVFFFCCGPARTGVVFFFLLWPRPDAHSLTVGWGDFGKARVVFFFLLRPRRVFLDNNKKCLGYYIGSKKTRRGHSKKTDEATPAHHCSPRVYTKTP